MELDTQFWLALLQIIYVNIILSGDNAVVIALACRALPEKQQKWGIGLGAGCAVVLRVIFTIFIVFLLTVPYLKIVGGLLLFWVGYKLLMPQEESEEVDAAASLWGAVRIVLIADAVMSLDNVIAVAAAAKGNYVLLVIGLLISVPLVVYGATLLIKLINRWPVIVPGGAALIGYIGAEIMIGDPAVADWIDMNMQWAHFGLPLIGAVGLVMVGRLVAPPATPELGDEAVQIAEEAAGAATIAAIPLLFRLVLVFASAYGYSIGEHAAEGGEAAGFAPILAELRPLLSAVIAVVVGEAVTWVMRRAGRGVHQT
jgi:YjbE family integral membrane protein